MFYFIVSRFQKLFLMITRGIRTYDKKKIPKKGPFLLICNHKSNNDPFIVAASTKRTLNFMAKDDLFKNFITKLTFRMLNTYPVDRDGDPREVLNQFVNFLKAGKPTVMFPEGTRNKVDDSLGEFKKGAALVAIRAQVPVVPSAILGSNKKRGKIYLVFGDPVMPPEENNKQNIVAFNALLQARVEELLGKLKEKIEMDINR